MIPLIGGPRVHSPTFRHLDVEFSVNRRFRMRIVERPGAWMDDAALDSLVSDIRRIVRAAVRRHTLAYGVTTGDRTRLAEPILGLAYDRSGRPAAFNALPLLPVPLQGHTEHVVHLGLGIVHPRYRRAGLPWKLYGWVLTLLLLRRGLRGMWVSNVSQVPAIIGNVAEHFADAYPHADPFRAPSAAHRAIARELMARHRHVFGVGPEARFDAERFVIENAYTGGSDNLKKRFAQTAPHRNSAYDELCRRALDYDRGDDFLQIARCDLQVILHFFLGSMSRVVNRWVRRGKGSETVRHPEPVTGEGVSTDG